VGPCDIGLIEGGLCNAENVLLLREFRAHCKTLVAVGACAITGGLPAQRNHLDLGALLTDVYRSRPGFTGPLHACGVVPPGGITPVGAARPGLSASSVIPNDPELPMLLNKVHPIHEVVHVDYFLPGCPPSADAFWRFLTDLMAGRTPHLGHDLLLYD
jgi:NAD-reducing hydrogenase small subunit